MGSGFGVRENQARILLCCVALGRDLSSLSLSFFSCEMERIKPTFQGQCDILAKSSIQWYLLSTYYVSGAIQGAGDTAVIKTVIPSAFAKLIF